MMLALVLAVVVAACDSDNDAAVVITQAAPTAAERAAPSTTTADNVPGGPAEHLAASRSDLPATDLSERETAALLHIREEEKLARDVYQVLGEKWGVRTFSIIAGSEQTHMGAVLSLIERYGLIDPAAQNGLGVFTDPDLQAMYDDLLAKGLTSRADALVVGASIEDLDIADLEAAIAATDNEDIAWVLGNLRRGSRNHLRAFARQLERNDVAFTPTRLTMAEYEEIVTSATEHG